MVLYDMPWTDTPRMKIERNDAVYVTKWRRLVVCWHIHLLLKRFMCSPSLPFFIPSFLFFSQAKNEFLRWKRQEWQRAKIRVVTANLTLHIPRNCISFWNWPSFQAEKVIENVRYHPKKLHALYDPLLEIHISKYTKFIASLTPWF